MDPHHRVLPSFYGLKLLPAKLIFICGYRTEFLLLLNDFLSVFAGWFANVVSTYNRANLSFSSISHYLILKKINSNSKTTRTPFSFRYPVDKTSFDDERNTLISSNIVSYLYILFLGIYLSYRY